MKSYILAGITALALCVAAAYILLPGTGFALVGKDGAGNSANPNRSGLVHFAYTYRSGSANYSYTYGVDGTQKPPVFFYANNHMQKGERVTAPAPAGLGRTTQRHLPQAQDSPLAWLAKDQSRCYGRL